MGEREWPLVALETEYGCGCRSRRPFRGSEAGKHGFGPPAVQTACEEHWSWQLPEKNTEVVSVELVFEETTTGEEDRVVLYGPGEAPE
jgi:hypothetical protein